MVRKLRKAPSTQGNRVVAGKREAYRRGFEEGVAKGLQAARNHLRRLVRPISAKEPTEAAPAEPRNLPKDSAGRGA